MEQTETVNRDKILADLKVLMNDADALIRATAGQAGEKVAAARAKAQEALKDCRARLGDLEGQVLERGKEAAQATDKFVHDQPWKAVGIAAGLGVIVGMLIVASPALAWRNFTTTWLTQAYTFIPRATESIRETVQAL